jgi:hypothetical protein
MSITPPTNLNGSAVVNADQNITVVVNVVNTATSGDTHAMYNASSR